MQPAPTALERFFALLEVALSDASLVKLTLGKPAPSAHQADLRNVFVRPVALKSGPHLSFVYRYTTRDVTKNFRVETTLAVVRGLLGQEFLDAHLFTRLHTVQFETTPDGKAHLRLKTAALAPDIRPDAHDRTKNRLISPDSGWLQSLGVTNEQGRPREGMAPKLRQIEKFTELLQHLLRESSLSTDDADPGAFSLERRLSVADMGCGKGYLTFATATLLGQRARVVGIESRAELVTFCTNVVRERGISGLTFQQGEIAGAALDEVGALDVLIALHACDTATDDALARGIAAGARLLVVSPCCQKELRPQLTAPAVLADALKHGIFQERTAEFVTDALRAQLLEWAGYRTKVFEFISTEHTAKNVMIAGIKERAAGSDEGLERLRAFAAFYGIRSQRLAAHLKVELMP